jgi:hypothetical protein
VIVLLILLESASHDVPLGTIGYGSVKGRAASGRTSGPMGVEWNSCRIREIPAKSGLPSARVGAGQVATLSAGTPRVQVPDRGRGPGGRTRPTRSRACASSCRGGSARDRDARRLS